MNNEEANQFINYNIKEGVWSPEQFEKMSDKDLIKFAEYEMARGDAYADDQIQGD